MMKRIFLTIVLLVVFIFMNESSQAPMITDGPSPLLFLGTALMLLAGNRKNDVMK